MPETLTEGRLALQASSAAPTVLAQARAKRERLYASSGSGIKIDIHLGAVLYGLGQADAARTMLAGALAEMQRWPDNKYKRTECLLAHNHLAQMHIALGQADEAAAVLAHDATGAAERFYGRRLTLRLRWQRLFGRVDAALRDELQALADGLASPFNRALMALELARHLLPQQALAHFVQLSDSPVALQRPGLQLHAASRAALVAGQAGNVAAARQYAQAARGLHTRFAPFDMAADELHAVLAGLAAV